MTNPPTMKQKAQGFLLGEPLEGGRRPAWVQKGLDAKTRAKPKREEDLFQIAVCNFLDEHPRIQYWATPNNTYVGAMTGAKMGYLKKQKDMGLKKGAFDLNLLFLDKNSERVFGLMELKIKPNKLRPEQLEFKAEAEKRGAWTAVVYGERDPLGKWYMKPVIEALWAWGY